MAFVDLYIDATPRIAVQGFSNTSVFELPGLVQYDTVIMRVRLMERTSTYPLTPFRFIPNTGLGLELAIGDPGASNLTNQFTWTLSADPADPYFQASVPLNTSPINTAIGSKDSISTKLQIRKLDSGVKTTVLRSPLTIFAGLINDSTIVVPAGQTPLSLEAANALFLTRTIVGAVEWVCETDATKRRLFYVDANGDRKDDSL